MHLVRQLGRAAPEVGEFPRLSGLLNFAYTVYRLSCLVLRCRSLIFLESYYVGQALLYMLSQFGYDGLRLE